MFSSSIFFGWILNQKCVEWVYHTDFYHRNNCHVHWIYVVELHLKFNICLCSYVSHWFDFIEPIFNDDSFLALYCIFRENVSNSNNNNVTQCYDKQKITACEMHSTYQWVMFYSFKPQTTVLYSILSRVLFRLFIVFSRYFYFHSSTIVVSIWRNNIYYINHKLISQLAFINIMIPSSINVHTWNRMDDYWIVNILTLNQMPYDSILFSIGFF